MIAVLTTAPAASAGYAAGTAVDKGDHDHTPWPKARNGKISLCYIDDNGSGGYNAGEPLYLDTSSNTCAGSVAPKDIRLTASPAGKAGKDVKGTDSDAYLPFTGAVAHTLRYYDAVGKGKWDPDNTMYLDVMNLAASQVDVGDVRLTPSGDLLGLTVVAPGDPDINDRLGELVAGGVDVTTNEMVYKAGSAYYINAGGQVINTDKFGIENGDVRLNDKAKSLDAPDGANVGTPTLTVVSVDAPNRTAAGAPFVVRVTVRNDDAVTGAGLLETRFGGIVVDARGTPSLAPGDEATLVMMLFAPTEGPVALQVGDETREVRLQAASSAPLTAQTPSQKEDAPRIFPTGTPVAKASAREAPVEGSLLILLLVAGLVLVARNRRC